APKPFFRRLEDKHGRAMEIACRGQVARGAQKNCRVSVVTAAMKNAWIHRAERKPGFFFHRKCVKFSPEADCSSAFAERSLDHTDNARPSNSGVDLNSERCQFFCNEGGCAVLPVADFQVAMYIMS